MDIRKGSIMFVFDIFVFHTVIILHNIVVDLLEDTIIIIYDITHLFFYFLMNESI